MNTNETKKLSVPEIITNQIIAALERGVIPWDMTAKKPYNAKSLREYTGLNRFLLADAVKQYDDLRFLTFNEVKAAGGSVFEGESGHVVFFSSGGDARTEHDTLFQQCLNCKHCSSRKCQLSPEKLDWQTDQALLKDDAELCNDFQPKQVYVSRYYLVFNIQQTTLKDDPKFQQAPETTLREKATVDELLAAMERTGLRIELVNSESGYDVDTDTIKVLSKDKFHNDSRFFKHLFMQMSYACGHETRLNLQYLSKIEDVYSYGAIVGEMAAAMLCGELGIELSQHDESYTADYIAGLIRVLKQDNRFVIMAGNSAKRVTNYILEISGIQTEQAA